MRRLAAALAVLLASGAAAQDLPDAFPDLPAFTQPVDLIAGPQASGELWVAEQDGEIWAVLEDPDADSRRRVADLTALVGPTSGDAGFQSLALRPDGRALFVHMVTFQSGPLASVIYRFPVSSRGLVGVGDPKEVLRLEQPDSIHNGGKILFGPDGMLYVPMGDGGLDEGLDVNAQDLTNLFGSVLRLDVPVAHEDGYSIPADNPYVGNTQGWREEIWAYGLRNPWRAAFDDAGRLWVGDVGQSDWEEVNAVMEGANYGWPRLEGPVCFPIGTTGCDRAGLTAPAFTYPHDFETGGLSVTGGRVYRGSKAPFLVGRYVFADLITHRLWSLDPDDPSDVALHGVVGPNAWIVAFGEGGTGELYAASYTQGRILDIGGWAFASDAEAAPAPGPLAVRLAPNPARTAATVTWASGAGGTARVQVVDVLGRTVQAHETPARAGRQRLELGALAPGAYAVRVATPEAVEAARLTVVR